MALEVLLQLAGRISLREHPVSNVLSNGLPADSESGDRGVEGPRSPFRFKRRTHSGFPFIAQKSLGPLLKTSVERSVEEFKLFLFFGGEALLYG